MENNHTAGKWAIRDLEIIGPIESNKSICEITGNFMDEAEAAANAKLISKSPEMLWLLGWIVNEIETTPDELSDALLGLIKIRCNETIKAATN